MKKRTVYNWLITFQFMFLVSIVLLGLGIVFHHVDMAIGTMIFMASAMFLFAILSIISGRKIGKIRKKMEDFQFHFDNLNPTLYYEGIADEVREALLEAKNTADEAHAKGISGAMTIFHTMKDLAKYWGFNTDLGGR